MKCKRDFKKREKVTKVSNFQLEHLNNISQNTEGHPIKTKILYFVVFYFTEIKNKQKKKKLKSHKQYNSYEFILKTRTTSNKKFVSLIGKLMTLVQT